MALILDLPYQDQVENSSGYSMEGFATNVVRYSGKISQVSFEGADVESSREEVFDVKWAAIQYSTPEEVLNGSIDQLGGIRDFYRQIQTGYVRYKPFESGQVKIWRIVKNSLRVKNVSGCINSVSLSLEFMYNE